MRPLAAIAVAALAIALSGCVFRGKPNVVAAAPAPKPAAPEPAQPPAPPAPLSIPQTKVELPEPQPLTAEALATIRKGEEEPLVITPAPPPRSRQRNPQTTPAAPKPETVAPPPAAAPTAASQEDRPPIRAIEPAAEMNRLQKSAENYRREAQQLLRQLQGKPADATMLASIQNFLRQSEDEQQKGEMRNAFELAERALLLARGLQGGR